MVTKLKKPKAPTMETPNNTHAVENGITAVTETPPSAAAVPDVQTLLLLVDHLYQTLVRLKTTDNMADVNDNWYRRKATTIVDASLNHQIMVNNVALKPTMAKLPDGH